MSERRSIEVAEYEAISLPFDDITDADLGRLQRLQRQGYLSVIEARTGIQIKVGGITGVLRLDRVSLSIAPKIAFASNGLLQWLCYATATPAPHEPTLREWMTARDGFSEVVAAALLSECRTILRDGLQRNYLRRELVAPVLRGRLDAAAQVTKRFGMLDQLHTRTFEREADIWENQICTTALRAAYGLSRNARLARELACTAAEFPGDTSVPAALEALNRATYTRLNRRYRAAHMWAGLILRGGGVANLLIDSGDAAQSILLDMPKLWEAAVRRMVDDATGPPASVVSVAGGSGIIASGDLRIHKPFRPDILVQREMKDRWTHFPIDAKYKRYDRSPLSANDIQQLLTYVTAYSPEARPVGAIVHPHPQANSRRTVRVRGNHRELGTIEVLGIATDLDPVHAVEWMRELLPTIDPTLPTTD